MAEPTTRSWLRTLAWILATLLLWPAWFWFVQTVVTYPVSWATSLASEPAAESQVSPGLNSFVAIGVLALAGLAFGFLGVYLLRRLGAPRIVWVPAAVVSVSAYVAVATFWASFAESGRGWETNMIESVADSASLGLTMTVGAWLAARDWRGMARGVRGKRRREHTADEFGWSTAAGGMVGYDPPMIGAASVIALDGVVERESGATPPPPPFTMKTAAIGLGVMFALGGVVLALVRCFAPNVAGR